MQITDDSDRSGGVLLWDLDNMPGPRGQLLSLAQALTYRVSPGSPMFASGRRGAHRWAERELPRLGIEVISGGRGRSGADRCLCDRGRTLRRSGHERFVVVSNDKFFACLSRVGDLHVVTLDAARVSRKLVAVAAQVTALDHVEDTWSPRDVTTSCGAA